MSLQKIGAALLATTILATGASAQDVELTIESWRNDDLTLWQDKIIPAFEAANPGIKVTFAPSAPAEYNAVLNSKLDAGSAGDLITCRPFDASLALYDAGHLADLSDLGGMANFSDVAKSAWQTDDGSATFCVPMASVIHGFIYNKDAFARTRAGEFRKPKPSSLPPSTRSRKTAPISRWRWAPTTSGKPPPWGTTTSARTTGRARKAARR